MDLSRREAEQIAPRNLDHRLADAEGCLPRCDKVELGLAVEVPGPTAAVDRQVLPD